MASFSKLPLSRQILWALSSLSLVVFSALSLGLYTMLSRQADHDAQEQLKSQFALTAGALDNAKAAATRRGESIANTFLATLAKQGEINLAHDKIETGPIKLPKLTAVSTILNANDGFLSDFKKLNGVEAALLVKDEGKVYRIATMLKDKDGKPMHGSLIPDTDPLAKAVHGGKSYGDIVVRNGKYFAAKVSPIKNSSGSTIAFVSIRVDLAEDIAAMKKLISAQKFGDSGYFFAIEPTGG